MDKMHVSGSIFLVLLFLVLHNIRKSSALNVGPKQQRQIVDRHNQIRHAIMNGGVKGQPRGVGLKNMVYDNALAQQAQKIADTHVFAHKKVSDGRWPAVGQNLYISMSTAAGCPQDWIKAVNAWYDEYKSYKYPNGYNHYTQLVWATTYAVGCGYSCFDEGGWHKQYYVCNYGPAGNYIGQAPYKKA